MALGSSEVFRGPPVSAFSSCPVPQNCHREAIEPDAQICHPASKEIKDASQNCHPERSRGTSRSLGVPLVTIFSSPSALLCPSRGATAYTCPGRKSGVRVQKKKEPLQAWHSRPHATDRVIALLLLLFVPAFPQTSRPRFDDHIQAYVRNGDFSGSVLVAKSGHVIFQKSYGMANYEWSIPNSEKTKFHIASVTKTFTASAIVLLEREGRLKLTHTLSKYIPDYLNGDRITIEQMLTHSSGLPDFYSLPEYAS